MAAHGKRKTAYYDRVGELPDEVAAVPGAPGQAGVGSFARQPQRQAPYGSLGVTRTLCESGINERTPGCQENQ
jgi:hypothetical protein